MKFASGKIISCGRYENRIAWPYGCRLKCEADSCPSAEENDACDWPGTRAIGWTLQDPLTDHANPRGPPSLGSSFVLRNSLSVSLFEACYLRQVDKKNHWMHFTSFTAMSSPLFFFVFFSAASSNQSPSCRVEKIFPKDQGGQGPLYSTPPSLVPPPLTSRTR